MSGSGVCFLQQSLETVKAVHAVATTMELIASYVNPKAYIFHVDQWIRFDAPGPAGEKLLEIPIGQVGPEDAIVITVGIHVQFYNTPESDINPRIGISDSKDYNLITIHNVNDYKTRPPCMLFDAITQENNLVSEGTQVSATYTLTFFPEHQYGACTSAQNDGYMNTGTFEHSLDLTQPLSVVVHGGKENEVSYFRYIQIEVMKYNGNMK